MDVISDIAGLLGLRASVYFHSSFCGSWAMDGANAWRASFHLIARGNCWVHLTGQGTHVAVTGGDLVVLPREAAHTISSDEREPDRVVSVPPPAEPDEIPTASLVCGYFDFASPQANPLLDAMPDIVIIRNEEPARPAAMNALLGMITAETENAMPGSEAIVDRLSEILFIHVVRTSMNMTGIEGGVLAALADRQLGGAVAAIHERPGHGWTVERLAAAAGMSRSAFAGRFMEVTGMPPMQYVTRWRMQRAFERLRCSKDPVSDIAAASGYQTEASFRKAFKQHTGVPPGAVRKGGLQAGQQTGKPIR